MKNSSLISCLCLLFLFFSCSKIEKEVLQDPFDYGEFIYWGKTFLQGETETTAALFSTRNNTEALYISTPNNVYVGKNPVSKEITVKAFDLLERNDTIFALLEKESLNGNNFAVNGGYFIAPENFWWEKDEKGLYKNMRKQIGVAKNSKDIQYRIKHSTETVSGVTYVLPTAVEKFIDNKWVSVKMPVNEKNYLTNIFITADDVIFLCGVAGAFDSNNHFIKSEAGPAYVIRTKDNK